MSQPQSSARPNKKSLSEHSHYFGAFLNIARHNAYMVIMHLSAKYNTDDKDRLQEDSISQAKLLNVYLKKDFNKPDVTQALIRDLKRYFPFLNYPLFLNLQLEKEGGTINTFETDPEQVRSVLVNMFTLLNSLRNNFSHYVSTIDYSRFDFVTIRKVYKAAIFRLTDRGKHTKRFDVFEEEHVKHLQGDKKNSSIYYPVDLTTSALHENTIAFITCLFLERKYAFPFLSRLGDFQNTSGQKPTLAMKATMECYTMFCCRLPQPKLESSDILLDMVNELGRCPAALYTLLSKEDKDRFHVHLEVQPYVDYDDEDFVQEVILKRHGDRFPYFALRYFDDTKAFPSLRFDVNLGRWRTRPVYMKGIYGEERERLLTKQLHTFARLGDLLPMYEAIEHDSGAESSDEKSVLLKRRLKDEQFVGLFRDDWITKDAGAFFLDDRIEQFYPKYNFGDKVIALKFVQGADFRKPKDFLPELPVRKNDQADAVISIHELRSLFLYDYLSKTPVQEGSVDTYIQVDAESFIKDYIQRVRRFFHDVKAGNFPPLTSPPDYRKNEPPPFVRGNREETKKRRTQYNERQELIADRRQELNSILQERYGLSIRQIPSRIKEYLLAYKIPSFVIRARQKFEQQQRELKTLLKDIEKGRTPRVGEQATWLAEDIVFLTPPQLHYVDGKAHPQKLNNDQFRVLQSSLAYFSVNKPKIIAFLKEETSILSNNVKEAHPFLNRINIKACNGILDFYAAYLQEKEKWLLKTIKSLKNGMGNKKAQQKYEHYLPSSVKHKKATELDYSNLPVYLPRGLFSQSIAMALAQNPQLGIKPKDSPSYCLAQLLQEDCQDFYGYRHLYPSIFTPKDQEKQRIEKGEYSDMLQQRRSEVLEEKKQSGSVSAEEKQRIKNEYNNTIKKYLSFFLCILQY